MHGAVRMDLRRRLQRRTLISAAIIFTALLVCLAWWTLHDTRREIESTRSLVRNTVAAVLRAQLPAPADEPAASNGALRHVTIELALAGSLEQARRDRSWIDRSVDAQPEEIALAGLAAQSEGRVLLVKPNARSEFIEHLLFSAAAFGALVLLGLVIAATQYRTLIRAFAPVQTLKTQLETFGRGDLSARLPVPELDELAVIAHSFNRLADSLQQMVNEQRRLSQSLISMRTEERHRLARELHDDLGQLLTAISVNVASLKRNHQDPDHRLLTILSLERDLQGLREATRTMLADLREAPDQSLLSQHEPMNIIADWQNRFAHIQWQIAANLDEALSRLRFAEYEIAARVLQEALTNIFRHANPTLINIGLSFFDDPGYQSRTEANGTERGQIDSRPPDRLIIENDGILQINRTPQPESLVNLPATQLGITGMHERARQIGAELRVGQIAGRWQVELRFART
jgi:two-component system, NarL family, sensor histidine kinase UhpB